MPDHFTHAYLDEQSRAWLRDWRGDLWQISLNYEFGPEIVLVERGTSERDFRAREAAATNTLQSRQ